MVNNMDLNTIAEKQFDWVERMGWHNKTVLEALALIASEVGETAEECFGSSPTKEFGEELSDIVLRIADLSYDKGYDLQKLTDQAVIQWRSKNLLEDFAEIMVDLANWINTARKATLNEDFGFYMGRVVKRVIEISSREGVNLEKEILRKMEINEERGTRGRIV
jgi:dimeric dUTPase (all-alpha-NTP-PPase superfamily)